MVARAWFGVLGACGLARNIGGDEGPGDARHTVRRIH